MRLTELDPKFIKFEVKEEKQNVIDTSVYTWQDDAHDYVRADGMTWRAAGCPTIEKTGPREYIPFVDSLAGAQGISFLCPKCFLENNGPVGTHHVHMPFSNRGVDPVAHPHQWDVDPKSTGYDNLTTSPSYLIIGGCNWHGYITNGDVSII